MESKSLNLRQMRSLNKIGDCVLPGDGEFPSFSKSQCVELVDHALCNVSAQDLGGFANASDRTFIFSEVLYSFDFAAAKQHSGKSASNGLFWAPKFSDFALLFRAKGSST